MEADANGGITTFRQLKPEIELIASINDHY